MKNQILKLMDFHAEIPYKVLNFLNKKAPNFINRELQAICKAAERHSENYATYRLRPKKMSNVPVLNLANTNEFEQIAIVMQGPLMVKDDFTLETAKYYKKCYQKAIVIVSTWDDADARTLRLLRENGIIVVLSKLPDNCGHLNINYQVTNTLAGVIKAQKYGAKFICKTRTDQRLYHPNAIEYLFNLVKIFPVNNEDFIKKQCGRIVALCMPYGDMFYPYCLADFLYFGYADDIESLFSIATDNRPNGTVGKGMTRREIAENMGAPEIQLLRNYIVSMGGNNECTVRAYWQFVKNHMITIHRDEIGLFWPKYEGRYAENIQNGSYYPAEEDGAFHCYNFDFARWLSLYYGILSYRKEYEKYAEYVM